jgi:hypothetical protein
MFMGGMTSGTHEMPDGKMMENSAMKHGVMGAVEAPDPTYSRGFVPNLANELTIDNEPTKTNEKLGKRRFRFLYEFLENRVKRPLPIWSKNDYTDAINYLGDTSLKPSDLNRDLSAGYFGGAFPFGRTQTGSIAKLLKKNGFQFTFNEGFIPNFAPNPLVEIGRGSQGVFSARKSKSGDFDFWGEKEFHPDKFDGKRDQNAISHEYNVNKSLKDFEKEAPSLFAQNAISFTSVGKLLKKDGLLAGFEREVVGGSAIDKFATSKFGKDDSKVNYAFLLSESLAQAGAENIVKAYREKNGKISFEK